MLALLFAAAAAAAPPTDWPKNGWEEFKFIGWNRGCAAALSHIRFPPLGEATQREPSWTRLGTIGLEAETGKPTIRWVADPTGLPLSAAQLAAAEARLVREDFTRSGLVETVRPDAVAPQPGLEEAIHSTASLHARPETAWPPRPFALREVRYSPLGSCALAVFQRPGDPPDLYRYVLAQVPVHARRERAQAHATNARLLYEKQDEIYGALEEAAIAARMDPRFAEGRYLHARLLAAHGRFDEALAELVEAARLDARYGAMAREASEFEDVRKQERFKAACAGKLTDPSL